MIKETELRIGNLIYKNYSYPVFDIDVVTADTFKLTDEDGFINRDPIPLTPEILERCPQFKKWENSNTYEMDNDGGIILIDGNEVSLGGGDSCTYGMVFIVKIDYLHELQNLILDLTKQELVIKELQNA